MHKSPSVLLSNSSSFQWNLHRKNYLMGYIPVKSVGRTELHGSSPSQNWELSLGSFILQAESASRLLEESVKTTTLFFRNQQKKFLPKTISILEGILYCMSLCFSICCTVSLDTAKQDVIVFFRKPVQLMYLSCFQSAACCRAGLPAF